MRRAPTPSIKRGCAAARRCAKRSSRCMDGFAARCRRVPVQDACPPSYSTAATSPTTDPINAAVRSGDRVCGSDNYLSSMTGLPGLLVPMGYTTTAHRSRSSFSAGRSPSPTLLKLASGFEAQTRHRHAPATTPPLPGESFSY